MFQLALKIPLRTNLIRSHLSSILTLVGGDTYRPISKNVASQLQYYAKLDFNAFDEDFIARLEVSAASFTRSVLF